MHQALLNSIFRVLVININKRRCVFSRHLHGSNQKSRGMSGVHRIDILRTFFITTARDLAPELKVEGDNKGEITKALCRIFFKWQLYFF